MVALDCAAKGLDPKSTLAGEPAFDGPAIILRYVGSLAATLAGEARVGPESARVDGGRLALSFSNAGHNWPVIVRRSGERVLLEKGGTILGILEGVDFEEAEVQLVPGDVMVLYTDGVSEAANAAGELYGEDRLYALLERMPHGLCAREIAERLLDEVRAFLDGVDPQDDITLVVLRVTEPAGVADAAEPEPVAAETA